MEVSRPRWSRIRLSRWSVPVAIGAYEEEKSGSQELVLDVCVWGDFSAAAASDRLEDALDYAQLRADLETWIVGRRWNLLESFAWEFCGRVLAHPQAGRVELTVDKPGAQAPVLVSYTVIREK